MPHRHPKRPPIPTQWLMTDERMGQELWHAIAMLPPGAGIVFRHHATARPERRVLFAQVTRAARRRRLVLVRGGPERLGREGGIHGRGRPVRNGIRTWAAHSRTEAIAGKRLGADALFVSPVFSTRSHPGAAALGVRRAVAVARGLGIPVIALGGRDSARFRRLQRLGFHGWAAIDAWLPDQKRKAVPT